MAFYDLFFHNLQSESSKRIRSVHVLNGRVRCFKIIQCKYGLSPLTEVQNALILFIDLNLWP